VGSPGGLLLLLLLLPSVSSSSSQAVTLAWGYERDDILPGVILLLAGRWPRHGHAGLGLGRNDILTSSLLPSVHFLLTSR
jgi:hypothetical protein